MAKTKTIYRGDGFQGSITLRFQDACNADQQDIVPLLNTDLIEVSWPATDPVGAPVILSTANSGEIVITDPNGTISYVGLGAKSLLMKLGSKQTVTVVQKPLGGQFTTWELKSYLTVVDRANPVV